MGKITAADVNNLRKTTGVGMMECKKALTETDGDFEKAIDFLRKKGQKIASKRAGQETNEGVVMAKVSENSKKGIVVKINCETDFVAKNDQFITFVNEIADVALNDDAKTLDELNAKKVGDKTIADYTTDQIARNGEKIEIGQFEVIEAEKVAVYNHHNKKLSAIVGLNMDNVNDIAEIGKQLAMQIAASSPVGIDKDDVPQDVVEKEIEVGKDQAREEGKPENLIEKIALGKLNKFYKENTLLNQEFTGDSKKTVLQFLQEADKGLKPTAFKRIAIGA